MLYDLDALPAGLHKLVPFFRASVMVALTRNRKGVEDYFTSNYKIPAPNFDHVSKKLLKLSLPAHKTPDSGRPVSAKSAISRVFRYPEVVAPLKREIHAPCRQSRTRFGANSRYFSSKFDFGEISSRSMGNILTKRYERAKESVFRSLRYVRRDEVDNDTGKENVSEDSSVDEVEVVENSRVIYPKKDGDEDVEILEIVGKNDADDLNMKVESPVETIDLTSMSHELDNLELPVYKKLLDTVNKKNDWFKRLKFDIELLEKRRLLQPPKRKWKVEEPFIPLTEEEEAEVACALSTSNRQRVLVTHENSNIDITGKCLQCLQPGAWLNDEVINVYLELLKDREKKEPQKFLTCHFFNTFFYKRLTRGGYNYQSVRRWTSQRRLGYCLLECDKIFVPIHKEVHWCLAVINKKDEKFQYLDSLRGRDTRVMKVLAKYIVDEVKDKCGKVIDVSSWEKEFVQDLPEQQNGFDCGMFMIKYADFYSRDMRLCFSQEHMPYFRLRTAKEILRLKAE